MIFKFEVVGIDHNYIPPMSSKVHLKYIDQELKRKPSDALKDYRAYMKVVFDFRIHLPAEFEDGKDSDMSQSKIREQNTAFLISHFSGLTKVFLDGQVLDEIQFLLKEITKEMMGRLKQAKQEVKSRTVVNYSALRITQARTQSRIYSATMTTPASNSLINTQTQQRHPNSQVDILAVVQSGTSHTFSTAASNETLEMTPTFTQLESGSQTVQPMQHDTHHNEHSTQ